jgi:hypothetical protein
MEQAILWKGDGVKKNVENKKQLFLKYNTQTRGNSGSKKT